MNLDKIVIKGAREHNLKNINLEIPKNKLVVITGVSGSGKSTLAFDTIYSEGQRKYVESLSAYARQFLQMMNKPDVDSIDGLSPAISIEQKTTQKNPRSTVGTVTEIYDYLRVLYARVGVPYSPTTGKPIKSQSVSEMTDLIIKNNIDKIYQLIKVFSSSNYKFNSIDDINSNQQHRFITLIDILYDKKIPIAVTAEKNLDKLTSSKSLKEPFKRTISRLYELTSSNFNL